jgi:hypothetical protein
LPFTIGASYVVLRSSHIKANVLLHKSSSTTR